MHISQYPKPVASGGLAQAAAFRPLRGPPSAYARQPDLGGAPRILGLSGLGTGAAAMVAPHGQDADQSAGIVVIRTGTTNPSATGVLQLSFPVGVISATSHVFLADWASFTYTPSGNILMGNWTANRPLNPRETLLMAYQWTVSG